MLFVTSILFVPFALAAVGRIRERSSCSDVHLFLARGNGEPYPGRVGDLAGAVCSGLPSCDFENIMFSSSESYCDQVADGATSGISQVTAYASRCPNSKLILGGYSLGAQVVGDMLGGGGGGFYNCEERTFGGLNVGSLPGSQIAAILMFGDVRHTADQSYNVGPGSGDNGQYPRSGSQLADLNQFSAKMRSYCLSTDPICALGDDGYSHTTYMQVYAADAASWAQVLLGLKSAPSTSSSVPLPTVASISSSPEAAAATSTTTTSDAAPSSTSISGAAASSSTDSITSSAAATITSSAALSSSSSSSSLTTTYTPFVFSSSYTTSTSISTATPTPSSSSSSTTTTTRTTSHIPASTTKATTTSSSKAGAHANGVQLTMTLLTLVVVKALAF